MSDTESAPPNSWAPLTGSLQPTTPSIANLAVG